MIELVWEKRCFQGWQRVFSHQSKETQCKMEFAVYVPDSAKENSLPALWFLSGLTCTWQNVVEKGGFQKYCSEQGLIFICPDTSPRGEDLPNDETYDLGQGAGFYLDATQPKWADNFKMYSYITSELQQIIRDQFPVDASRQGICGHSMGGHGSLVLGLRNPDIFKSISAFAPIANPNKAPWGQRAFENYLGDAQSNEYDAVSCLAETSYGGSVLIDQGGADSFLSTQLSAESFLEAAKNKGIDVEYRLQPDFDHSYFFISSFSEDHVSWHSKKL